MVFDKQASKEINNNKKLVESEVMEVFVLHVYC